MPSKVTIATVARHANVSRQTVSNVLNAPGMVRDETRARVMAAIEELGYRANLAARQMRTGRSRLIGIRIDPVRNGIEAAVLDRFLHALTETAAPAGYRVVLYTASDDATEIATYDELLATYALDAFVLTHTHHGDARTAWLSEHDVVFTTFGRPWGAPDRHSWVDVDGASGTAAATAHLIGAGHRRIAFLGWPPGSGVGDDRRSGWAAAMRAANLPTDGLAVHSVDGVAEGEWLARELLDRTDPPTAAVCASDPLALGAWRTRKIAVIGFDDTPMAQAAGLSSVAQPVAEAARSCVGIVTELLGERGAASLLPADSAALRPADPAASQPTAHDGPAALRPDPATSPLAAHDGPVGAAHNGPAGGADPRYPAGATHPADALLPADDPAAVHPDGATPGRRPGKRTAAAPQTPAARQPATARRGGDADARATGSGAARPHHPESADPTGRHVLLAPLLVVRDSG